MIDNGSFEQFRNSVRRYVRENLVPLEAKVAEEDRVPDFVLEDFRAMGLFGLSTPDEYCVLVSRSVNDFTEPFEFRED